MTNLISMLQESIDRGDVTISSLARAANCSRQHVYRILSGESDPSFGMAEKLAIAAGISVILHRHRELARTSA